jgi:hypothetical protein
MQWCTNSTAVTYCKFWGGSLGCVNHPGNKYPFKGQYRLGVLQGGDSVMWSNEHPVSISLAVSNITWINYLRCSRVW